jgi:hypothetical protein
MRITSTIPRRCFRQVGLALIMLVQIAYTSPAHAEFAYLRSSVAGPPFDSSTNEGVMDAVFGAGNWLDLRYESVDPAALLDPETAFIFMEGSDDNATELVAFLDAHRTEIEDWVAAGGRLLLNARVTEGGVTYPIDVGFDYEIISASSVTSIQQDAPEIPIWAGPNTPTTTSMIDAMASNCFVGSSTGAPIVQAGTITSSAWGQGFVTIGCLSLARSHLWFPATESANFHRNLLHYSATGGILLTTNGQSSNNISAARALARNVSTTSLETLASMPATTLGGYDAIWINPDLTSMELASLQSASSAGLNGYVVGGGTLVVVATTSQTSGDFLDIAPGDGDLLSAQSTGEQVDIDSGGSYTSGQGFAGLPLDDGSFDAWSPSHRGHVQRAGASTTILSTTNTGDPTLIQYSTGAGTVYLTSMNLGAASAGALAAPLTNLIALAAGIEGAVTESSHQGALSRANFTLRIPEPTGDTLPEGDPLIYGADLFATGAEAVNLDSNLISALGVNGGGVPALLDVRVWGHEVISTPSEQGPFGNPDVEIPLVEPRQTVAGGFSWVGAPVAANVVADIDYSNIVTRLIDFDGPSTDFYLPGARGIRSPLFWVELSRFGSIGSSGIDGASIDQRFLVPNLELCQGGSCVDGGTVDFMIDTSSRLTVVDAATAALLGIGGAPDVQECWRDIVPCTSGELVNGYTVTSLELGSDDGVLYSEWNYHIDSPTIFVTSTNLSALGYEAVLGTNLFEDTAVLWDGPNDRIGFIRGVPAPEPGIGALLSVGLLELLIIGARRARSPASGAA